MVATAMTIYHLPLRADSWHRIPPRTEAASRLSRLQTRPAGKADLQIELKVGRADPGQRPALRPVGQPVSHLSKGSFCFFGAINMEQMLGSRRSINSQNGQ